MSAAAAEFGVNGGEFAAVDGEGGEAFVDGAAGANTFDNLLAEVATFFEVDAVEEAGFLDEVAIEDFDAEAGLALFAADGFPGIEAGFGKFRQEGGARNGPGQDETQTIEARFVEAGDVAALPGENAVGLEGDGEAMGGG